MEARLAEREAAANEAIELEKYFAPSEFDLEYQWVRFVHRRVRSVRRPGGDRALSSSFAPGAPSPREVLRQCAALRTMLAAYRAADHDTDYGADPTEWAALRDKVIIPMAAIWSTHQGYQQEWAL
ncbi:DUF6221 family protein [Nocardia niigatensis]